MEAIAGIISDVRRVLTNRVLISFQGGFLPTIVINVCGKSLGANECSEYDKGFQLM